MSKARKIYISADFEGTEGVVSMGDIFKGSPDYYAAQARLMADINAAVRACFDMGVEEVVVCDGHADMENVSIDALDPRATLISGAMRSSLQMQEIEQGFDGVIVFGHAGAGVSMGGVIDHCYSMNVYNIRMNGVRINTEAVMNAYEAGQYGVPLIAIIGDEAVAGEVAQFVPQVEQIVLKKGLSRFCAHSVHPKVAQERIYNGVKRALERIDEMKPVRFEEPATMEMDFMFSNTAEAAELIPGVERTAPRTVRYTGSCKDIFNLQQLIIFRLMDDIGKVIKANS